MASLEEEVPGLLGEQNTSVADHSVAGTTDETTTAVTDSNASEKATNLTNGLAVLNLAGTHQILGSGDAHHLDNLTATNHQYKAGEEEALWHRIKAYLKNPVGPKPKITCPICRESLYIHGITPRPAEEEVDQLKTTVMLCGHMYHHACMRPLIVPGFSGHCPYCRQWLVYSCYCACYESFAPTEPHDDPDDVSRVPLTLPEGARPEDRCSSCIAAGRKHYWSHLPEEERTFHGVVFSDSWDEEDDQGEEVQTDEEEDEEEDEAEDEDGN